MIKLFYFVARRNPGKPAADSSQAMSWHKTLDAANRTARRLNRTGSDVQVYASSTWGGK